MRNLFYTLIVLTASTSLSYAQCNLSYTPNDTTICPGDSVWVSAFIPVNGGLQSFNFNAGSLPSGWSTTGGQAFSTPCGPSPNGTPYYWASTSGTTTPQLATPSFNLACGATVTFDMVYSVQGGPAPCEGPDQSEEGVELQYSLDGGLTWLPVIYYSPAGFSLPQNPGVGGPGTTGPTAYTTWGSYSVTIPPGAFSTSTMFRWIQEVSSSAAYDNWGLDNISITPVPCAPIDYVNWSNGLNDTLGFWFQPNADSSLVALSYDSTDLLLCTSDSINIFINTNTIGFDLVDTLYAYCTTDSLEAEVTNVTNAIGTWSLEWSTGQTINPVTFGTNGNEQDTILYTVDITHGCGFSTMDSVWILVNQTLAIDTVLSFPTNACEPYDGAVSAIITNANVTGVQFNNWVGPGTSASFNIDGSASPSILSPGWYYYTLTDDVCQVSDSIEVIADGFPEAIISPETVSGCAPINVDFVNTSENSDDYLWIWGDFTTNSTLENPSHTFNVSSNVIMIVQPGTLCADTAYATIIAEQCGCTDPAALNYDPNATSDPSNTCIFAQPTVIAPNVFTPNGDDVNDLYSLEVTNASEVHLIILNRWGNLVFDKKGLNPVWDGTAPSGNKVQEGTYFYKYVISGISENIEPLEGHGFIQVINN